MRQQDKVIQDFSRSVLPKLVAQLNPEMVLVFGSRARGEARADSDLDVLIVAEAFNGMHFLKRMPAMLRLARFARPIDFLCYTPAEFSQIQHTSVIVDEAIREGIVLYRRNGQDSHLPALS